MRIYDSIIVDGLLQVAQVQVTEKLLVSNIIAQADWTSNTSPSAILNKPNLSSVSYSGRYSDLLPNSGQPTFNSNGSVSFTQQNADWAATSGVTKILNKPSLSALATSASWNDINPSTLPQFFNGSYSSLTNVPQFANVCFTNNFTDLNANSLPEISDIGASGYLSEALYANGRAIGQLGAVCFSNRYSDLSGIPAAGANASSLAAIATSGKLSDSLLANGASVGAAGIPSSLLGITGNIVSTTQLSNAISNATSNLVSNAQLISTLQSYATTSSLSAYATTNSLSAYATTNALSAYATTNALSAYANIASLNALANTSVQRSALANVATSGRYSDLIGVPSNTANASSLSTIATTGLLSDTILSNGISLSQAGNLKTVAFTGAIGDTLLSNGTTLSASGGLSNLAINAKYSQLTGQPTALSQFTNDLRAPSAQTGVVQGPFTPSNVTVTLAGGMQQWAVSVSATYSVSILLDGVAQTEAVPQFDLTSVHSTLPTVMFASNLSAGPHTLSIKASNTAYTTNSDIASFGITEFAVGQTATTSTWIYPTPLNNWVNTPGFSGLAYKKTATGETRLRGLASGGAFGLSSSPMFTLPTGYLPSNTFVCSVASDGVAGEVRVYGNGAVVPVRGNNYVSLDNILY